MNEDITLDSKFNLLDTILRTSGIVGFVYVVFGGFALAGGSPAWLYTSRGNRNCIWGHLLRLAVHPSSDLPRLYSQGALGMRNKAGTKSGIL